MRKAVSQWTIQREVTLTILITSLIPLTLSNLYLYSRINILYEERITAYSREVMHQAVFNIENIVGQTEIIQKQIIYWAIVKSLLDTDMNAVDKYTLTRETSDFIKNLRINFPFLTGIYISNEEHTVFFDTLAPYKEDIASALSARLKNPLYDKIVVPPEIRYYLGSEGSVQIMSFYKKIVDFNAGGKSGIIQIDIDFTAIRSIIDEISLGTGGDIYLYSNHQNFPYVYRQGGSEGDPLMIRTFLKENNPDSLIVINQAIENSGWSLLAAIPSSSFMDSFSHIKRVSVFLVILFSFLAVVIGLFMANRITLPLTDVVDKIYRFGKGDFTQKLPHFNNHDLSILAENFNNMTTRIEGLMNDAVKREKEKEKAELIALQAQINPHFLYNTLEVVRGISLQKKVPEISSIIKSLAGIFRYSINREQESVPLSRELQNISNYLNVQNYRYIGRFEYTQKIPEDKMNISIPRLILQPIIENIFKHAVESRVDVTRIGIGYEELLEYECIVVENTGPDIPKEKLESIETCLHDEPSFADDSGSIGLVNVHRRLCLFNGSRQGLSITSQNGFTRVNLFLRRKEIQC